MRVQVHCHRQTTPATIWTVEHNCDSKVNVDVTIDVDGIATKVYPLRLEHLNSNTLEIEFSNPRIGAATVAGPWKVNRENVIPFTP